jgi:hypothetical protein
LTASNMTSNQKKLTFIKIEKIERRMNTRIRILTTIYQFITRSRRNQRRRRKFTLKKKRLAKKKS